MNRAEEVALKVKRVQELMASQGWGALLLTRTDNFAWITGGGRSHINIAADGGVAQVLVTAAGATVLTNNIERPRILAEELAGSGLEVAPAFNWWNGAAQLPDNTVVDTSVQAQIAPLRWVLTEGEKQRAVEAGLQAAQVLEKVARQLQPGETEFEVAGKLSAAYMALGFEPTVVLVASDERIFDHRHPLPTGKKVRNYLMLVGCCRKRGVYYAVTRFVHFGSLSASPFAAEIEQKLKAVAHVDAAMINATRPGARVADIFARGVAEYEAQGYGGQWQLHHQGGAVGYVGREYFGTPESPHTVQADMLFAWNPSITGVKSEDTFLVEAGRNRMITETGTWPYVEAYGLRRPAILVR